MCSIHCHNSVKISFYSAFMFKCIKPISEWGSALRSTRIDCLFHFQRLASANVLHAIKHSSALLTGRKKKKRAQGIKRRRAQH